MSLQRLSAPLIFYRAANAQRNSLCRKRRKGGGFHGLPQYRKQEVSL